MLTRVAIFVHRWLGVALCLLFLLWFASGIGMMYWTFPEVTAQPPSAQERETLDELARLSRERYRAFVWEEPRFVE